MWYIISHFDKVYSDVMKWGHTKVQNFDSFTATWQNFEDSGISINKVIYYLDIFRWGKKIPCRFYVCRFSWMQIDLFVSSTQMFPLLHILTDNSLPPPHFFWYFLSGTLQKSAHPILIPLSHFLSEFWISNSVKAISEKLLPIIKSEFKCCLIF